VARSRRFNVRNACLGRYLYAPAMTERLSLSRSDIRAPGRDIISAEIRGSPMRGLFTQDARSCVILRQRFGNTNGRLRGTDRRARGDYVSRGYVRTMMRTRCLIVGWDKIARVPETRLAIASYLSTCSASSGARGN